MLEYTVYQEEDEQTTTGTQEKKDRWYKTAWEAVKKFFTTIGRAIAGFFVGIWNKFFKKDKLGAALKAAEKLTNADEKTLKRLGLDNINILDIEVRFDKIIETGKKFCELITKFSTDLENVKKYKNAHERQDGLDYYDTTIEAILTSLKKANENKNSDGRVTTNIVAMKECLKRLNDGTKKELADTLKTVKEANESLDKAFKATSESISGYFEGTEKEKSDVLAFINSIKELYAKGYKAIFDEMQKADKDLDAACDALIKGTHKAGEKKLDEASALISGSENRSGTYSPSMT